VVLAHQDGGVVGVEDEGPLVGALLSDPVVVGDGPAVVGAADPLVVGAELEAGCLGRLLHRVEGGEEGRGVHAVAVGNDAWSTTTTSCPGRASSMAVADPATRPPTTTTS
jgi:hypothetical protein